MYNDLRFTDLGSTEGYFQQTYVRLVSESVRKNDYFLCYRSSISLLYGSLKAGLHSHKNKK